MMIVKTEQELADAVKSATGPLRIRGGGTRDIGNLVVGEELSTSGLNGITLYEPGALTIVAQAGTPVADIEAALESENQRLAFEPMDHRTLLGSKGTPTIGGVVATNASGPRRISVGACRDHLLGVRFVNGDGTIIKNGGRVMKNVTGYDLVKLMAGSYGTLGVLSEVSLKVLPKPETETTLVLHDLSLSESVTAMSAALGSPFEVTGAAVVGGMVHIRIEGFETSVAYRTGQLQERLGTFGEITVAQDTDSSALWHAIRDVSCFADHDSVTRVSIQPSAAPGFAERLWQTLDASLMLDWGGGLMWFAVTDADGATHKALQDMSAGTGGHAILIKGPESMRVDVPVFQPEKPNCYGVVARAARKIRPTRDIECGADGMISGLAFTFVLMPCIAACVFATFLRDWRLVAAAVFGAFGFMALYEHLNEPVRLVMLPILIGVLSSAIGLFPYVLWRRNNDIWGRMIAAVVPTFLVTFMILIIEFSGG